MDIAIAFTAVSFLTAFAILVFTAGFKIGPQSGKVWSLGGPRVYPKGHLHTYDPTGEYTYKHQNPKFR